MTCAADGAGAAGPSGPPAGGATLATAGHVDHGKTALVRALTGVETDRLPEEQRRGISITCGHAPLTLAEGVAAIVDVPGHERFIREMVGGVGGVDAVLLVVAADAGVMPQTREHLAICRFLGVSRLVVALSRADLADASWRALSDADVAATLAETPWSGAPRILCSAVTGEGIGSLREALAAALTRPLSPRAPDARPFAMPIDRVFSVNGFGTVVTGTCHAGSLGPGDSVTLARPGGALVTSRVRSVERHGLRVERGQAGERLALNLPDLGRLDTAPGATAFSPHAVRLARHLEAFLTVDASARRPLRAGDELVVQLGFATGLARLSPRLAGEAGLGPGASGPVGLRFRTPMPWFPGVPAIVRGFERLPRAGLTLAGGHVLAGFDRVVPARGRALTAAQVVALARGETSLAVTRLLEGAAGEGARLTALAAALPRSCADLEGALAQLTAADTVVTRGDRLFLAPFAPPPSPPPPRPELASDGRPDALREPALDPDAQALSHLVTALLGHGLTPPWRDELPAALAAATGEVRPNVEPLIARGLRSGVLVRVSPELIYPAEALQRLEAQVLAHFEQQQAQGISRPALTVADLKTLAGATRRWAMPLVAWLDQARVTVRDGDVRRPHPRHRRDPQGP